MRYRDRLVKLAAAAQPQEFAGLGEKKDDDSSLWKWLAGLGAAGGALGLAGKLGGKAGAAAASVAGKAAPRAAKATQTAAKTVSKAVKDPVAQAAESVAKTPAMRNVTPKRGRSLKQTRLENMANPEVKVTPNASPAGEANMRNVTPGKATATKQRKLEALAGEGVGKQPTVFDNAAVGKSPIADGVGKQPTLFDNAAVGKSPIADATAKSPIADATAKRGVGKGSVAGETDGWMKTDDVFDEFGNLKPEFGGTTYTPGLYDGFFNPTGSSFNSPGFNQMDDLMQMGLGMGLF